MNTSRRLLPFILAILLFLWLPVSVKAGEVHLSVASSMAGPMQEMVSLFTRDHPDVSILLNSAASGSLAKQIIQGAPAHLFISANQKWMDYLLQKELISRNTVTVLTHNRLVFIGLPNPGISTTKDIRTLHSIAIGSPRSVPAGEYAAQAMEAAGIYNDLLQAHKLVMAKDVRQALLYADRGEVDGAFIYKSDALLAKDALILFSVPEDQHAPVSYPMGLTLRGSTNSDAITFYRFLKTNPVRSILKRHGFSVTWDDSP
jgi:molybdate transport system substrate-binding protein